MFCCKTWKVLKLEHPSRNILNKGLFLTNCWFSNLNIEGGLFDEEIFINGGVPVAFLCSGYLFSPLWGFLMVHCTSLTYRVFNLQCSGYLFSPSMGFLMVHCIWWWLKWIYMLVVVWMWTAFPPRSDHLHMWSDFWILRNRDFWLNF